MHMKRTQIVSMILILVMGMTFGCSEKENTNSSEDYTSIQNNWTAFENHWNAFNTEGCVSIYTEDAEVIAPDMAAAAGKEAIAEFYHFLFSNNQSAEYSHTTESLTVAENQAIEYGNFSVDWVSNDAQSWTFNARVLVHWIKNQQDEWKIQRLLFNTPPELEAE